MSDERLYGVPGAERMDFDLASAYESQIEPWHDEHDNRPLTIEEWSVCDTVSHVPPVDLILDNACEWAGDNGLLDEDGFYAFENAARRDDVRAAFQAALDLWASKVKFRMADKCLRTYTVTWDEHGNPLVDGEPLYVAAPIQGDQR